MQLQLDPLTERGISYQGFVPIRAEPAASSAMISQLLFGETFRIIDRSDNWLRIQLDFDGTEGWLMQESIQKVEQGAEITSGETTSGNRLQHRIVALPVITVTDLDQGTPLFLPAGSIWPSAAGNRIFIAGSGFELLSETGLVTPGPNADPEEIGKGLISLPHLDGGRSGFGFDAAGLLQLLCRIMGIQIPRRPASQAELGININFLHEARKGDLAFFDNGRGEIIHSGFLLNEGEILHVADQVRIDKLDQHGIFSTKKRSYTHQLRVIKRLKQSAVDSGESA